MLKGRARSFTFSSIFCTSFTPDSLYAFRYLKARMRRNQVTLIPLPSSHSNLLYRHSKRIHYTRAPIHHHISPRNITTKPTSQKPGNPCHLRRRARPFQPHRLPSNLLTLQLDRRQLRALPIVALQTDADVDLAGGDGIDADAGALEGGDAGAHDAEGRVRGHGEGGAPAAAGGAGDAGDDDDGAVFLVLGGRVGVVAFWGCFGHGRRGVFEGVEGDEGVGFVGFVEVVGSGAGEGGGA